jgi:CheY-like chemotaxis protein
MTLPESLSVLFVEDDLILRKLFSRTLRKVAPGWTVREAANGETALRLTETESFDLIFMDQYMSAFEKQLLGTETVVALRAKGVTCRICGLSANDVEKLFEEAGADAFMFKPFPTDRDTLVEKLWRILYGNGGTTIHDHHEVGTAKKTGS